MCVVFFKILSPSIFNLKFNLNFQLEFSSWKCHTLVEQSRQIWRPSSSGITLTILRLYFESFCSKFPNVRTTSSPFGRFSGSSAQHYFILNSSWIQLEKISTWTQLERISSWKYFIPQWIDKQDWNSQLDFSTRLDFSTWIFNLVFNLIFQLENYCKSNVQERFGTFAQFLGISLYQ